MTMNIGGWLLGLGLTTVAMPAAAAIVEVGPGDDVEAAINAAQPGDEIVLADGEYSVTDRFSFSIAGTEAQPIIIRAADGASPHINRPNADQNIIDIDSATWVEIRGIEFSGGSAGIRISAADHLTIEDCEIHGTEDVAVRANDGGATYESLHIIHNHIHDTNGTGEGMYLGCNRDACRLANGLIERNWVHHTNQAGVSQGDGIELKEGSYGTIIRDNVIHDTNYPCILTYSAVGNGPANVIERNVLWNCGDHGIQSAADAIIRNNIILSANASGIAMQLHQSGSPQNLEVTHNTILKAGGDAIALRDAAGSVLIANNAVYAQAGSAIFIGGGNNAGVVLAGNVGQGGVSGGAGGGGYVDGDLALDFVAGHFGGAPPIDVFPAPAGALVGAGDAAYVVDDDFNTLAREGAADVGAYAFDPDGNPGWTIAAEFKDFPDGGGTTTGAETGDSGADSGGLDESGGSGGAVTSGNGSAGSGSNDDAGTDPTSGTGASAGAGDDEGGGCGCRSTPSPVGATAWSLALLLLVRRRRRSVG